MLSFESIVADMDATLFDAFAQTAIYDSRSAITIVIDKAVPYADDDGQVFSTVDEMHVIDCRGLTIELGKTVQTDDKTYKVQRFLRQSGSIKTFEVA
jgi:hypothetical protein